ncbi:helix-turn-helix domain-containing protein [Lysobacter spongiae]|uniref:CRP-like protein Clp n=1 Tax=Marilutibacter spongiae TaxID=2025720 RepID=A0A7W3TN98_9GAMM|nr:helix-turn-helix domain-containing protein [Lysobacter spongiae]
MRSIHVGYAHRMRAWRTRALILVKPHDRRGGSVALQDVTNGYRVEVTASAAASSLILVSDEDAIMSETVCAPTRAACSARSPALGDPVPADLEAHLAALPLQRRRLQRKQVLFRTGQPCHSLFLVHAGLFKTCVLSEDGREKITGFHLRGDLLGVDSFDMPVHACDAFALDTCEAWELPFAELRRTPGLLRHVTAMLAGTIRNDWRWMLALGTLSAEQRVAAFLLDLSARHAALGFSDRQLMLRMTRAELGNFLALQLETVTRALSRLASTGLIDVDGRAIRIADPAALAAMLAQPRPCAGCDPRPIPGGCAGRRPRAAPSDRVCATVRNLKVERSRWPARRNRRPAALPGADEATALPVPAPPHSFRRPA